MRDHSIIMSSWFMLPCMQKPIPWIDIPESVDPRVLHGESSPKQYISEVVDRWSTRPLYGTAVLHASAPHGPPQSPPFLGHPHLHSRHSLGLLLRVEQSIILRLFSVLFLRTALHRAADRSVHRY